MTWDTIGREEKSYQCEIVIKHKDKGWGNDWKFEYEKQGLNEVNYVGGCQRVEMWSPVVYGMCMLECFTYGGQGGMTSKVKKNYLAAQISKGRKQFILMNARKTWFSNEKW